MELLDRKRQLLRLEDQRLVELREQTERNWSASCSEAQSWGARSALLGGSDAMALSALGSAGRAFVEISWRNTMGVRHPDEPHCSLPVLGAVEVASSNAAVAPAAAAYRRALEAAVHHAVTQASYEAVDAELRATDRRHRAIERHRLPRLEEALRQLELRLDELERSEQVVTRWAKRRLKRSASGTGIPAG